MPVSTVNRIERGHASPTTSTLDRLFAAASVAVVITVLPDVEFAARAPGLSVEERKSLALHLAMIERLVEDPTSVLAAARRNLARRRRADPSGRAAVYLDEWERLLEGPFAEVVAVAVGTDHRACDLRHVTPFAGVLSDDERRRIIRRLRDAA